MRRLTAMLLGILLAGLAARPALAQPQPDTPLAILQVDSAQFPWLSLDVAGLPPGSDASQIRVQVDGKDTPVAASAPLRQPLDVAFVADLTARMSDKLTPFSSRFEFMRQRLTDMVIQLQGSEPSSDQRAGLIAFSDTVQLEHPQTSDLGGVLNTLQGSDTKRPFVAAPLGTASAADAAPYPLGEALLRAAQQLSQEQGTAPRALVALATGSPTQPTDTSALAQLFAKERAAGRPISLLIIGYGAEQPDAAQQIAADPAGLGQLAQSLGGQFVAVRGQPSVADYQALDQAFDTIIQRGLSHRLQVRAPALPGGTTKIQVSAAGMIAETSATLPATLPPFSVKIAGPADNKLTLSIALDGAGAAPTRVQYLLDNRTIVAPVENGPDFSYTIDLADSAFQQRFAPGSYALSAALWDTSGNQARSAQPVQLVVVYPWSPAALLVYWWALIPLFAGVGAVVYIARRRRPRAFPQPGYTGPVTSPVSDEDRTYRVGSASADEDATSRLGAAVADDEVTSRLDLRTVAPPAWCIDVLEGDEPRAITLAEHTRYYDIGRRSESGKQPEILLNSRSVSRSIHASLTRSPVGFTLLAAESTNGTFIGETREPLIANEPHELHAGDIFWVGGVKLRIRSEVDDRV